MNEAKCKNHFQYQITKCIELISKDWLSIEERKTSLPLVGMNGKRPLIVLLTWVASKRTHAYKHAEFYLEKGFDVLVVSTSTWQMLMPITGFLVTSSDLADFLNEHQSYQPILIHGFSIGCIVWCYTEEKILKNLEKYQNIKDRLAGYILDSPPTGKTPTMLSYIAFEKDSIFRVIGEHLIHGSLLVFYFLVYKYFIHGIHLFFNSNVKLPKLMLISKDDPISPYERNMEVCEVWKSKGMSVNVMLWQKSVHVSHFLFHKQEYINEINLFLKSIGLVNISKY